MKATARLEQVAIEKLIPYANNARTHSAAQIAKLRSSLREFGFVTPVIIDKDFGIIAGHGRVMAAQAEGLEKVPCVFAEHLTPAQKKAYILADNRLALDAGWNEEILKIELEALKELDFDISLTGFEEIELEKFNFNEEIEEDNFDVEAELEKPCVSKSGDILIMNKHKIICGDTTEAETYTKLLGGEKVNLVCTDPPYFVNLESRAGKIANDDLSDAEGYEFLKKAFENFNRAMTKDASIYIFYATSKARIFHDAYEDAGFKVGAGLVWKKNQFVLTRTDWKYIHESIISGWKKDGTHHWYGDNKQVTVFEFDRIKNSKEDGYGHPSSKPVPLIAYLIGLSSKKGDAVLDGFIGSGSTLIACEELGRVCYGVELEPKYLDVAAERYAELKDGYEDITTIRNGKKIAYSELKEVAEKYHFFKTVTENL